MESPVSMRTMANPSEAATPRESVCSKARPPMAPSVISDTCSLSTWTAGSARTMKKPISIASGTSSQLSESAASLLPSA